MNDIQITTDSNGRIGVTCPYDADFVADAKNIGGRWAPTAKQWTFDSRDEARVRDLVRSIYGTDGSPEDQADLVTVRITVDNIHNPGGGPVSLRLAGRNIATRRSRDEDVVLGQGVILISGGFRGAGGSMKYPELNPKDNTVLEVRDVPRSAVDEDEMQIVDETIDAEALLAKRERLLAEIADIDRTLATHGHTTATTEPTDLPTGTSAAAHTNPGVITITIPVTDGIDGLSTTAYAAHAGCSPRTARRWAATGRIPATRTPSGWVITA